MRSEGFYVNENSIDTSWDRTSDLPIVAQCLNNCATAVPPPPSFTVRRPYLLGHIQLFVRGSFKTFPDSFLSEKWKRMPSFKLLFFQNSPLLQLYISAKDCKRVGVIPGSRFVEAFSALPSHF